MKADFLIIASLLAFSFSIPYVVKSPSDFVTFRFRQDKKVLIERMYPSFDQWTAKGNRDFALAKYDTVCNVFYEDQYYVEIIRQDDKVNPEVGLAFGFEYDPEYDSLPYTTTRAVMQYKNFKYGGMQFSEQDTFNHTGVVNEFSEDFILTVTAFYNDTIEGNFKGILLNGAGEMTSIEDGQFRVGLYRKKSKN